jgi:hypothetical protein
LRPDRRSLEDMTVAADPDPYYSLPALYGAPAYARAPKAVPDSERPLDPDDLPIAAHQTDEERALFESIRGLLAIGSLPVPTAAGARGPMPAVPVASPVFASAVVARPEIAELPALEVPVAFAEAHAPAMDPPVEAAAASAPIEVAPAIEADVAATRLPAGDASLATELASLATEPPSLSADRSEPESAATITSNGAAMSSPGDVSESRRAGILGFAVRFGSRSK